MTKVTFSMRTTIRQKWHKEQMMQRTIAFVKLHSTLLYDIWSDYPTMCHSYRIALIEPVDMNQSLLTLTLTPLHLRHRLAQDQD